MNIDRRTTCVNHENYTPLIKCSHQQWTRRYGISIGYVSECVHLLLMQLSNITRIWCRWPLLAHRQSQRPPKRQHIPKIPSSMPVSLMHRTHTTHILIDHTVVGYTFYCTAVRYESIDLKQLQTDCYKRNYVSNCSSCHVDSFAATWYRFAEMEFDAHRLKIRNANRMETSFFGIEDSVHCVPVAHFSFIRSIYLFHLVSFVWLWQECKLHTHELSIALCKKLQNKTRLRMNCWLAEV